MPDPYPYAMTANGWAFTKTYHREPYEATSPTRPELSQAGKTVLITGGTAGIGYAIARAFVQASAAQVIILGRDRERGGAAAAELQADTTTTTTKVTALAVDISDASAVEKMWADFAENGTVIDVLVLNAASVSVQKPVLELGAAALWARDFDFNVRVQFDLAERFYKQEGKRSSDGPLYLVHVSTNSIHDWNAAAAQHGYGVTKLAGATALQAIALETPPHDMQVASFNPGPNYTQAVKDAGYGRDDFQWQDENLAGQFAVWLASPEAKFLHGRYVWSAWDIDELKSGPIRKRIDEVEFFLRTGVQGLL
ncbi:hypothetical protein SLS62_006390 [Diatrype stigma]|uniref:Ketoreductase domain-containing protein n=1 Tax=Diatrype stigma TaxID=117547 RepID=A0AAN9YRR2_9PEZI